MSLIPYQVSVTIVVADSVLRASEADLGKTSKGRNKSLLMIKYLGCLEEI
jgi:hypothetical protein